MRCYVEYVQSDGEFIYLLDLRVLKYFDIVYLDFIRNIEMFIFGCVYMDLVYLKCLGDNIRCDQLFLRCIIFYRICVQNENIYL